MLDHYLVKFRKLRTAKDRNKWTKRTTYRAPHKPFLMLSVIDLVANGTFTKNFIEPSFELAETFAQYWKNIMPLGTMGKMAYPFFHMRSEGFWELVPVPGTTHPSGKVLSSLKSVNDYYLGARINSELFALLLDPATRDQLRTILVHTYFDEEVRQTLYEQGMVNYAAQKYSDYLLKVSEGTENFNYGQSVNQEYKVRDQGFRKAIIKLYVHRCALCGIRMLTADGHTVVEAAHILPWSESNCKSSH